MNDVDFYRTRMGRTFYEHTVPALVEQLARMNGLLDRIASQMERKEGDEDADT